MKIGIVGAAGTGKSSLARAIAKHFSIPVLESKAITQKILERDGYDFSSGIQVERFLANTGRQNEMLRMTMEQEDACPSFVTDRTVIDLAAYVVCEMHDSDVKTVRNVVSTCQRRSSNYTCLFVCPWVDKPIDDNAKRTLNPWYQFLIHSIEVGLLQTWGCHYETLHQPILEDKIAAVIKNAK